MSLVRDLWSDPDPIKWVIFGGAFAAAALGGVLYFQSGKLSTTEETLSRLRRVPPSATAPSPGGSLQLFADRAKELSDLINQVNPKEAENALQDPSNTIYSAAAQVRMGAPTVTPSASGGGGATFRDTVISVTPQREAVISREILYKFLYNVERVGVITTTFVSMTPRQKNHRPGMTLEEDLWTIDTKFTIRVKKDS